MLLKDMLEARASEWLGASIDEQFRDAHVASNRKPCSQAGCDTLPESKDALLPAFSHHADIDIACTECCITDFHSDQFGYPKTAGECQVKHGAIADAMTSTRIGSIEYGLHFNLREMPNQRDVGLLKRNGQDSTKLFQR